MTTTTTICLRSKPASSPRSKMITAIVGFIFCGAAAMLSVSPVTVELKPAKATSFSILEQGRHCLSQPVECLESAFHKVNKYFVEGNSIKTVEKPLLQAILEEHDLVSISLPMIPKNYLPLYASDLAERIYNHIRPSQPEPEPTIITNTNNFLTKSIQQISSFSSSSYIACATRIKGSVVTKTSAGDQSNNKNNKTDEKLTMVSSYTACAIRVKDSVVKNCHDFFLKFVTSSETSAGDNKRAWAWVLAVGFVAVFVFSTGGVRGLSNVRMAIFVVVIRVLIHWIWVVVSFVLAAILIFYLWGLRESLARDAKIDEIEKLLDVMEHEVCDHWKWLIMDYYERKYGRPPTWEEFYKNWFAHAGPWKTKVVEWAREDPFIVNGSTDATAFVESIRRNFQRDVAFAILDTLDPRRAIIPYNQ